jgi:hypothetical protein
VHVDVVYALTGVATIIYYEAVSRVSDAELARQAPRRLEQAAHQRCVFIAYAVHRRDVPARNDEHVHRCARVNVVKRQRMFIFVREARWNSACCDATEKAIVFHNGSANYFGALEYHALSGA